MGQSVKTWDSDSSGNTSAAQSLLYHSSSDRQYSAPASSASVHTMQTRDESTVASRIALAMSSGLEGVSSTKRYHSSLCSRDPSATEQVQARWNVSATWDDCFLPLDSACSVFLIL